MLCVPEDAVLRHAVLLEAPLVAVKVILGYVEADRADGLKARDRLKLEARELEDREIRLVLQKGEDRNADVGAHLGLYPGGLPHEPEERRYGALAVRSGYGEDL